MAASSPELTVTVLGSGTSTGVPMIGCQCAVCTSKDPRDQRLRPSICVSYGGRTVLIDTTPDFRHQAMKWGVGRVDAVLYTHSHADHILGLDDVRPFNFLQGTSIPIYAKADSMDIIQRVFSYVFSSGKTESSRPRLEPNILTEEPVELFGVSFQPIPLCHGSMRTLGFRFGPIAYLTDHSEIPEPSKRMLEGLDVLFLDALRHKPHPTHSTVETALRHVAELQPRQAYFTHISHDLPHAETDAALPEGVNLAYDGLRIQVEYGA